MDNVEGSNSRRVDCVLSRLTHSLLDIILMAGISKAIVDISRRVNYFCPVKPKFSMNIFCSTGFMILGLA